MDNLFSDIEKQNTASVASLAARMRPNSLDEIIGQDDVIGKGTWLYDAINSDTLSSIILFGPAGTGKTSIANVVAQTTEAKFVKMSAVGGTVADLRREISLASDNLASYGKQTILFVDEIHRFNKGQQDALLHAVEDGVVVLIGATTENPYFEVNTALISRSHIIQLHSLSDDDIKNLIKKAARDERGLNGSISISDEALKAIVLLAGGDGRASLNILELASSLCTRNTGTNKNIITKDNVDKAMPSRCLPYDKDSDMHYDIISAFIKSMRGSDADAALYWMARMLEGGEDPKFIARRIYILASEDIGNADPHAILVAEAAFKAVEVIGLPECRINLAQAAVYMALAPKSNSCVMGIDSAINEVKHGPLRNVPDYLRDRHRPGAENYGEYKYPHDFENAWVDQQYLPDGLNPGDFYQPSSKGWEARRAQALDEIKQRK